MIDAAAGTITLPVEPGTDLTDARPDVRRRVRQPWSRPTGRPTTPRRSTLTVTKAAGPAGSGRSRPSKMRSPVLPGLYADPNIAEFDGTYYIYATTDGTPGWGGKDFYVWSLARPGDWTRSEGAVPDPRRRQRQRAVGGPATRGRRRSSSGAGSTTSTSPATTRRSTARRSAWPSRTSPTGPFTAPAAGDDPQQRGRHLRAGPSTPPRSRDPVSGKHYLYWGNGAPRCMAELADDMVSLEAGNDLGDVRAHGLPRGLVHELPQRDLPPDLRDRRHRFRPNYRVGYATLHQPPPGRGPTVA